jgi:hypothetical protein
MNIDDMVALYERNPELYEVRKKRAPEVKGARQPITIEIPLESDPSTVSEGSIIQTESGLQLIHDIPLPNMLISHTAKLVQIGEEKFEIQTVYAYAKQRPTAQIACFGVLDRKENGFVGHVVLEIDHIRRPAAWVALYD